MYEDAPDTRHFGDRSEQAHQVFFGIAESGRQRRNADARLHRIDKAQHAVIARDDPRVGRDFLQPYGGAVIRQAFFETDQRMFAQRFDAFRLAMLLDILPTGVYRP